MSDYDEEEEIEETGANLGVWGKIDFFFIIFIQTHKPVYFFF